MNIKQMIALCSLSLTALCMSSCEKIFDDPKECGLYLDFRYDYNMLYANAFSSQVGRIDVYVFDRDSNFLFKQTDEGEHLTRPGYRMKLDVSASHKGDYMVMAWAGDLENFDIEPSATLPATVAELKLRMSQQEAGVNNTDLGDLWYGELRNISYLAEREQTEKLNLIKDTNRFRFILQKLGEEGKPISADNLSFQIITDNSYYNHKNEIIPTAETSYQPYFMRDIETVGAVAELNTMRLLENNPATLIISYHDPVLNTDKELLNVDLMKYLLATQMEGHRMSSQEYLDRQSEFVIAMFYTMVDTTPYLSAKIIINDWTVWFQDVDE